MDNWIFYKNERQFSGEKTACPTNIVGIIRYRQAKRRTGSFITHTIYKRLIQNVS